MSGSQQVPFGSSDVTFIETLDTKKVGVLRAFTKEFFPEWNSAKMVKKELVQNLASALLDEKNKDIFIQSLTSMDELLYQYFLKIIDQGIAQLPLNTDHPGEAETLQEFKDCIYFYCHSVPWLSDLHACVIPTEVREYFPKYRKICEEHRSPLIRIHQYIGAAVRLYGIVTLEEFKEIITRYEPELLEGLSDRDLTDLFRAGEKSLPIYLYVKPNLVHPAVYHFDDDVNKSIGEFLKLRYKGSRWYPDTRKEFLSFMLDKNLCNPKDRKALADVFQDDGIDSNEACEDLVNNMIELVQMGMHPKNLVCIVARIEQCEMDPDWQENLLNIFTRLGKTTRLMRYNGYTLEELEPYLKSEKLHDLAKNRFGKKE